MTEYTTYRCTCGPGIPLCEACRDWIRTHRGNHTTGLSDLHGSARQLALRKSPRRDGGGTRDNNKPCSAMTRDEILAEVGAWVVSRQRLPVSTDWRKGSPDRPPLNCSRIYDHWGSMDTFWESLVANGYATKRMLQVVRMISGRGQTATRRGLQNARATRRHTG